jgi:hypothetical protein
LKQEEFDLVEKICPATIYERINDEVEQKEKALETKL